MRIGIIGAGQLGQMLGVAANALGHQCVFLDPAEGPPAAREGRVIQAPFDDVTTLQSMAANNDVITYEFENVPVATLLALGNSQPIFPPPEALRYAQDRLSEKGLFESLDIDLPPYRSVDSEQELEQATRDLGLPLVLKTRRLGYDGKGQSVIRTAADSARAWGELGGRPLIAETFVPFDYEVSIIGVRNAAGDIKTWPLTHNEHADGILRCSRAPVDEPALSALAGGYIERLLEHLDYVGVLALELFVAGDRLLANEFAPRVHNSGHWTIEGAITSQFTNHILAIVGETPQSTDCRGFAGMVNLIGHISEASRELQNDRCWLHDYGKEPRPGRKLGHISLVADSATNRDALMAKVLKTVT